MASQASARPEIAEVDRHKRFAHFVQLGLSIPLLLVILVVEGATDPFVRAVYPGLVGLLAVLLVALVRDWIPLSSVGIGILIVTGGGVMLRLADLLLSRPEPLAERLLGIVGGHYWAVTVVMMLGFLLFNRRTGLWVGAGMWTTSLTLAVIAMLRDAAADQLTTQVVVSLGRVHAFLAMLLAIVAGAAALREQLDRALERAEVLNTQAMTDPLTGLANRTAGNDRLTDESADAHRRERPLTIVLFDIDHFKAINDAHGHAAGDEVLVATAEVVGAAIRPRDLLVRWGGEEFLVILPETIDVEAAEIAERARLALSEARPHGHEVTATFGVAGYLDDEPIKDLLARADAAMYEGKRGGRNQVVLASDEAAAASDGRHRPDVA